MNYADDGYPGGSYPSGGDGILEEDIAAALRSLAPARTVFRRGVARRIAASEAGSPAAGSPDAVPGAHGLGFGEARGGRSLGWLSKAAAIFPPGLIEASSLSKAAMGGGAAAKGGSSAAGLFSVAGAMVVGLMSLVGLLTLGLLRVGRSRVEVARREASRPERLSDRMNYAEDSRWIGIAITVLVLGTFLVFFHSMAVAFFALSAALLVGTVLALVTFDQAGRGTRATMATGFAGFFGNLAVFGWKLVAPPGEYVPAIVAPGMGCLLVAAIWTLWFYSDRKREDWAVFGAMPLLGVVSIWYYAAVRLPRMPEAPGGEGIHWLAVSQYSALVACAASIAMVLLAVRAAPRDVFAGPSR